MTSAVMYQMRAAGRRLAGHKLYAPPPPSLLFFICFQSRSAESRPSISLLFASLARKDCFFFLLGIPFLWFGEYLYTTTWILSQSLFYPSWLLLSLSFSLIQYHYLPSRRLKGFFLVLRSVPAAKPSKPSSHILLLVLSITEHRNLKNSFPTSDSVLLATTGLRDPHRLSTRFLPWCQIDPAVCVILPHRAERTFEFLCLCFCASQCIASHRITSPRTEQTS